MKTALRTLSLALLMTVGLLSTSIYAQEGALDKAQPNGVPVDEIIKRMAQKETDFKKARELYTYRQTMKVQTLDGDTVDGEYLQVFDSSFDDKGGRVKSVVFAPQSTLAR